MRTRQIAKVCYEANRAYCQSIKDFSQWPWNEIPKEQRKSYINGVEFYLEHPESTSEDVHNSWLAEKDKDGWRYGPKKDAKKKIHPCILPYVNLPQAQKIKDTLFIAVISALKRPRGILAIKPIFSVSDKADTIGFLRGFVKKYKQISLTQEEIFGYLGILVGPQE